MGNETSNIQNSNAIQLTAEIGLTNNILQGKERRLARCDPARLWASLC